MANTLLETSRQLAGWETRRSKTLAPLIYRLGKRYVDLDERLDWNTVPLTAYLAAPKALWPLAGDLESGHTGRPGGGLQGVAAGSQSVRQGQRRPVAHFVGGHIHRAGTTVHL